MGAEVVKTVATAAIREAKNRDKVVEEIEEIAASRSTSWTRRTKAASPSSGRPNP